MKTTTRCFTGLVFGALCVLAGECVAASITAPFQPPQGLLFSQQKAPLQWNNVQGASVNLAHGQAKSTGFLQYYTLFFAWGDCSIEAAAQEGGLARVDYVDYEYLSVLNGFFNRTIVHVYGPRK